MADKRQINISIGIVLMTLIVVFLMRYKGFRVIWYACAAVFLILSLVLILGPLIEEKRERAEQLNAEIRRQNIANDGYYYAAQASISSNGINTQTIRRYSNKSLCLTDFESSSSETKCIQGDGRYTALFNKQAIGRWYTIIEYNNHEVPLAIMEDFDALGWSDDEIELYLKNDVNKAIAEMQQSAGVLSGSMTIVSPDGRINEFLANDENADGRNKQLIQQQVDMWMKPEDFQKSSDKFYVVKITPFLNSYKKPLGIVETFIFRRNSKEACEQLHSELLKQWSAATTAEHGCVPEHDNFRKIFSSKAIGVWYMRVDYLPHDDQPMEYAEAYVYSFDDEMWDKDDAAYVVDGKGKRMRDEAGDNLLTKIWVVSPDGATTSY